MSEQDRTPDPIDALLEREPYLDDAGFTDRVLARLPRRRDLRPLVLGISAATAAGIAAAVLPDVARLLLSALAAAPAMLGLPPALAFGLLAAAGAGVLGLGLLATD